MFKTRYTGLLFKFKGEWKLGRIGTFIKSYDEDEEFGTKNAINVSTLKLL